MAFQPSLRHPRWLLALGLLASAAAAHATAEYRIAQAQETWIHPGMTEVQVRSALGRPYQDIHYASEPGPTWTYQVMDPSAQGSKFDVDFGSNGKVASTNQQMPLLG